MRRGLGEGAGEAWAGLATSTAPPGRVIVFLPSSTSCSSTCTSLGEGCTPCTSLEAASTHCWLTTITLEVVRRR